MSITTARAVAGLATAAVLLAAVDPAAAFGPRIGGMAGFHAGLGAFHGAPGGRFEMGQRFRREGEFRMGDHGERFHHHGGFNPFLGGFAPFGYVPSDAYAPYESYAPYGLGLGYNISITTTSSTAAPSAAYAGDPAPSGGCVIYKLRYNEGGRYRGVTSFHPCQ